MTILQHVQKALRKVDRMSVRGLPRALILLLLFLVLLIFFLYVAGWVYLWRVQGKVDLPALKELLVTMTGMPFLVGFGMLIKCLYDRDKDGVPDPFEEGQSNVTRNPVSKIQTENVRDERKV